MPEFEEDPSEEKSNDRALLKKGYCMKQKLGSGAFSVVIRIILFH